MSMKPHRLRKKWDRDMCRTMRNHQWLFMERIRDEGVVWFCPWDKYRKHRDGEDGVEVDGLIGWGILAWMCSHKDWFKRGRWSEKRCARPVRLTEAGLTALENWQQYDMEPVEGGLVEPGWICIPTPLIRKAMFVSAHPERPSGTITVTLKYAGRGVPAYVEDI